MLGLAQFDHCEKKGKPMKLKTPVLCRSAQSPSTKKQKMSSTTKDLQRGRPELYNAEIAERICSELADGQSLVQIMAEEGMPNRATVYRWLKSHKDFCDNYVRAREEQADYFADECIEIADASVGLDSAGVAAMKLKIDARKWRAAVLRPKVYGRNFAIGGHQTNTTPIAVATAAGEFDELRAKLEKFAHGTSD